MTRRDRREAMDGGALREMSRRTGRTPDQGRSGRSAAKQDAKRRGVRLRSGRRSGLGENPRPEEVFMPGKPMWRIRA